MIIKRIALVFVVALVAAACGAASDDGAGDADPTPGTEASTSTTTAITSEPTNPDGHEHEDDAASDNHSDDEAHNDDEAADHDDEAGHDDDVAERDAVRTIEIVMNEFAYEPAAVTVSQGESVEFVVINTGEIEHEFRLTTEHAALEHIAAGHEGHNDDAATESGHEHGEIILVVGAGEEGSITVSFDEHSDYNIVACLLPDHYEAGMHAALNLEG